MQGFITYKLELWPDLIIQAQDIRNILSQDKYSKSGHFNFGLTIEFRIRDFMLNHLQTNNSIVTIFREEI